MSSYFNMISTCPESSNIINKVVVLGKLPILSYHMLFHGTTFSKHSASSGFLILAAINSFASLPQVFPIAWRNILGVSWSLLLSCSLGFRIHSWASVYAFHQCRWSELFFFFLVEAAVSGGGWSWGAEGGIWRNLGRYLLTSISWYYPTSGC